MKNNLAFYFESSKTPFYTYLFTLILFIVFGVLKGRFFSKNSFNAPLNEFQYEMALVSQTGFDTFLIVHVLALLGVLAAGVYQSFHKMYTKCTFNIVVFLLIFVVYSGFLVHIMDFVLG